METASLVAAGLSLIVAVLLGVAARELYLEYQRQLDRPLTDAEDEAFWELVNRHNWAD